MEKLLNLLQEFYGGNRKFSNDDGLLTMTNGVENLSGAYAQTYIISKQGGFIERLVKNNKIDFNKLEKIGHEETVYEYDGQYKKFVEYSNYETLLMLLAISDTPIEDLISYLR